MLGLDLGGGPACADTREREREMVGFMRYNYIIRSMSFAIRPKYKINGIEKLDTTPSHRIASVRIRILASFVECMPDFASYQPSAELGIGICMNA